MRESILIRYLSGLGLIWLAGCAGSQSQTLSSSAFEPAAPVAHSDPQPAPAVAVIVPATQPSPVSTLVILPAAPAAPTTSPAPLQSGQYNTLGGVVAEVNGTPIYADTLLNLEAKVLSTKAAQMDADEFHEFARQSLSEALGEMIKDEAEY